jgi:Zn-dependent protease
MSKGDAQAWRDSRFPDDFFRTSTSVSPSGDESIKQSSPRRQPWRLWLFLLTLLSLFWTGITAWSPLVALEEVFSNQSWMVVRRMALANWVSAAIFAFSLLAILTAHELGHYFMARYYRVRATPPIFIPFPFMPFGTLGAVIAMDGRQANRKEIFDIGLAGPLAGLALILPILILGMLTQYAPGFVPQASFQLGQPLLVQWAAQWLNPAVVANRAGIPNTELNPFLMAAWTGLLVTGLNMIPMSQLDGGHVIFGLLGRRSKWFAYGAYAACVSYLIWTRQPMFVLMLLLILAIGIKHPPSRDDTTPLGWFRQCLGWCCLVLPLLCVPPVPLEVLL